MNPIREKVKSRCVIFTEKLEACRSSWNLTSSDALRHRKMTHRVTSIFPPGPGRRSLQFEIQGQRAAAERLLRFEARVQALGRPGTEGLLGLLSGSGTQLG